MFLLYVNHICCSRQAHRCDLQVVGRYYYVLSFFVLFLLYKKHIICMCGNEKFIECMYFDLNVHFVTEKRCILFRNCAIQSCFKYMHYYLCVF